MVVAAQIRKVDRQLESLNLHRNQCRKPISELRRIFCYHATRNAFEQSSLGLFPRRLAHYLNTIISNKTLTPSQLPPTLSTPKCLSRSQTGGETQSPRLIHLNCEPTPHQEC